MTNLDLTKMSVNNKPHHELDSVELAIIDARMKKQQDIICAIRQGKKEKMPENVVYLHKSVKLREWEYK